MAWLPSFAIVVNRCKDNKNPIIICVFQAVVAASILATHSSTYVAYLFQQSDVFFSLFP